MITDQTVASFDQPLLSAGTQEVATRNEPTQWWAAPWLIHSLLLLSILSLNFFVRCYLDQAKQNLTSFLARVYPDHLAEIYALPWWRYLLPIEAVYGCWGTTGLLLVHGMERIAGAPAPIYYFTNFILIATTYCLSWHVLRSWVFTLTLTLCMALTTFNHHVYLVSGSAVMPLIVSYLLCFLFCQFKLMQTSCNYKVWIPLGLVSMVTYALSYESWLDCVVSMWVAYPFFIVIAHRVGDQRRKCVAGGILVVVTLVAMIYVLIKTNLGHGQGLGSESDVVFNYGLSRILVAIEDVIAHFFTLFFITISTYAPPFLLNSSISSWRYGTQHLIHLQHGYHEQYSHLVGYNHLFFWRFYAGLAVAAFGYWFWKSTRAVWQKPSVTSLGFFIFLLMTLLSGPTHMLVKYRPMHSAPFLGYHSYFGVVGFSMLLSFCAWWVHANFQKRWLAWTLIALIWINLGYCALARPSLLSHMAVQCGFSPYPDAWKNLKSLIR